MSYQKRILITGASGMLGMTLAKYLGQNHTVFATGNSTNLEQYFENYLSFNLENDNYRELINWGNPDIIIHCGALTNGNYCKENPKEAFNINGVSMQKFLNATTNSVKIIYISTDAVFPSELHLAKETDCVKPENVYGKSKELGEFFLLNSNRKYTIIRTTIVGLNYNKQKQGFVEWIVNSAKEGEKISLFDDVIFTPISIWSLSKEIGYIIKNDCINSEILHIAGNENCTKYEFGMSLLRSLQLDVKKIIRGSILNFEDRAKRCTDQTLDTSNYQEKYNRKLPTLVETINEIKNKYNEYN